MLSRWEELEPVEHRRPVPKALVDAMCVVGRSFLVLSEDLGAEPGSPCFLKVS